MYVDEARIESVLVMQDHKEDRVTLRLIPEIDGHVDDWTDIVAAPDDQCWHMDAAQTDSGLQVFYTLLFFRHRWV